MQIPRLHYRPTASASCGGSQGPTILKSTFGNHDACEFQEALHYFILHWDSTAMVSPSTPLISVLKFLWQKKRKKILWTVRHGATYAFLLAAGDYKCVSIAKLLLRHQVFTFTVGGLNTRGIFSLLMAVLWI